LQANARQVCGTFRGHTPQNRIHHGDLKIMKHALLALILTLTAVSWEQDATPTAPSQPQTSTEKQKCACCDKMASSDSKDMKMCARHGKHAKGGKGSCCAGEKAMSCCSKDGKSCMKDDKAAAACCKDCGKDKTASSCCGKDCAGSCCSKKVEAAMNGCRHASHS
jgi:hypothetical protein